MMKHFLLENDPYFMSDVEIYIDQNNVLVLYDTENTGNYTAWTLTIPLGDLTLDAVYGYLVSEDAIAQGMSEQLTYAETLQAITEFYN